MSQPVEIFFSYAHADEALMNDFRLQLILFERQGLIRKWHDRQIPPGSAWKGQIDVRLNTAQVILLFVSPHFFESDYCYDREMTEALRREQSGEARVIPIILRPCLWESSPFGHLQVLPQDGKPVTSWTNKDEAHLNVSEGIMRVVLELNEEPSTEPSTVQQGLQPVFDRKRDNTPLPKKPFSVQLAVLAPDNKRQISLDMERGYNSEQELFYQLTFVMKDLVDGEFRDRIRLSVVVESAGNVHAEKTLMRGLNIAQLEFLSGPVANRAKALPPGTTKDQQLRALLRQTLEKR